jgi:hypothetical protein
MPTNRSKNTKRRTKVKELSKKQKRLTGDDMKKVRGGVSGSAKAKTADKAFDAMNKYVRG